MLKSFSGHDGPIFSVKFSMCGNILVSSAKDDSVRVWDVCDFNNGCLKVVATKQTSIYSLNFTSRNILLAAGVFEK